MKRGLLTTIILVLSLFLLPACDTSDDEGGGVDTQAAGYTQSMLTGLWHFKMLRDDNSAEKGEIEFDSKGEIIRWIYTPRRVKIPPRLKGNIIVYPDGRAEGGTKQVEWADRDDDELAIIKRYWRLVFQPDGSLSGNYDYISNVVNVVTQVLVGSSSRVYRVWLTPKQ